MVTVLVAVVFGIVIFASIVVAVYFTSGGFSISFRWRSGEVEYKGNRGGTPVGVPFFKRLPNGEIVVFGWMILHPSKKHQELDQWAGWISIGFVILVIVIVVVALTTLYGGESKALKMRLVIPSTVVQGEEFDFEIVMENRSDKGLIIKSLEIDTSLLDAFKVNQLDSELQRDGNEFMVDEVIAPNEALQISISFGAAKTGVHQGKVKVNVEDGLFDKYKETELAITIQSPITVQSVSPETVTQGQQFDIDVSIQNTSGKVVVIRSVILDTAFLEGLQITDLNVSSDVELVTNEILLDYRLGPGETVRVGYALMAAKRGTFEGDIRVNVENEQYDIHKTIEHSVTVQLPIEVALERRQTVVQGEEFVLDVMVTNISEKVVELSSIGVEDSLLDGVQIVDVSPIRRTGPASNDFVLDQRLLPGETVQIEFSLMATTRGTFEGHIRVNVDDDRYEIYKAKKHEVTVELPISVGLEGPEKVTQGEEFQVDVTVTNTSNHEIEISSVAIDDQLYDGIRLVDGIPNGRARDGGKEYVFDHDLEPDETVKITLTFEATGNGTYEGDIRVNVGSAYDIHKIKRYEVSVKPAE